MKQVRDVMTRGVRTPGPGDSMVLAARGDAQQAGGGETA